MNFKMLALFAGFGIAATSTSWAAAPKLDTQDTQILQRARATSMYLLQLTNIAQEKITDAKVKTFMTNMVSYHTNARNTFTKIAGIDSAEFMAVGKASPSNSSVPAVYFLGKMGAAEKSLFRSIDNGATWTDLGVPAIGKTPFCMAADRRVFGRVYFGTTGNGLLFGEPAPGGRIN